MTRGQEGETEPEVAGVEERTHFELRKKEARRVAKQRQARETI